MNRSYAMSARKPTQVALKSFSVVKLYYAVSFALRMGGKKGTVLDLGWKKTDTVTSVLNTSSKSKLRFTRRLEGKCNYFLITSKNSYHGCRSGYLCANCIPDNETIVKAELLEFIKKNDSFTDGK
jgi:hypothetical protein